MTGAFAQLAMSGMTDSSALDEPMRSVVADVPPPTIGSVMISPLIGTRDIFAPPATQAGGHAPAEGPLGGTVVVGSIGVGKVRHAIVLVPGRGVMKLPIGGEIDGWRLSALSETGARFLKGQQQLNLPYGGPPAPAAETATDAHEVKQP